MEDDVVPIIVKRPIFRAFRDQAKRMDPRCRKVALVFDVFEYGDVSSSVVKGPDRELPKYLLVFDVRFLYSQVNQFIGNVTYFRTTKKTAVANTIKAFIDDLFHMQLEVITTVSSGKEEIIRLLQALAVTRTVDGTIEYKVGKYGKIVHIIDPNWLFRKLGSEFKKHDVVFSDETGKRFASFQHIKDLNIDTASDNMETSVSKFFSHKVCEQIQLHQLSKNKSIDTSIATPGFLNFFNQLHHSLISPNFGRQTCAEHPQESLWEQAVELLGNMKFELCAKHNSQTLENCSEHANGTQPCETFKDVDPEHPTPDANSNIGQTKRKMCQARRNRSKMHGYPLNQGDGRFKECKEHKSEESPHSLPIEAQVVNLENLQCSPNTNADLGIEVGNLEESKKISTYETQPNSSNADVDLTIDNEIRKIAKSISARLAATEDLEATFLYTEEEEEDDGQIMKTKFHCNQSSDRNTQNLNEVTSPGDVSHKPDQIENLRKHPAIFESGWHCISFENNSIKHEIFSKKMRDSSKNFEFMVNILVQIPIVKPEVEECIASYEIFIQETKESNSPEYNSTAQCETRKHQMYRGLEFTSGVFCESVHPPALNNKMLELDSNENAIIKHFLPDDILHEVQRLILSIVETENKNLETDEQQATTQRVIINSKIDHVQKEKQNLSGTVVKKIESVSDECPEAKTRSNKTNMTENTSIAIADLESSKGEDRASTLIGKPTNGNSDKSSKVRTEETSVSSKHDNASSVLKNETSNAPKPIARNLIEMLQTGFGEHSAEECKLKKIESLQGIMEYIHLRSKIGSKNDPDTENESCITFKPQKAKASIPNKNGKEDNSKECFKSQEELKHNNNRASKIDISLDKGSNTQSINPECQDIHKKINDEDENAANDDSNTSVAADATFCLSESARITKENLPQDQEEDSEVIIFESLESNKPKLYSVKNGVRKDIQLFPLSFQYIFKNNMNLQIEDSVMDLLLSSFLPLAQRAVSSSRGVVLIDEQANFFKETSSLKTYDEYKKILDENTANPSRIVDGTMQKDVKNLRMLIKPELFYDMVKEHDFIVVEKDDDPPQNTCEEEKPHVILKYQKNKKKTPKKYQPKSRKKKNKKGYCSKQNQAKIDVEIVEQESQESANVEFANTLIKAFEFAADHLKDAVAFARKNIQSKKEKLTSADNDETSLKPTAMDVLSKAKLVKDLVENVSLKEGGINEINKKMGSYKAYINLIENIVDLNLDTLNGIQEQDILDNSIDEDSIGSCNVNSNCSSENISEGGSPNQSDLPLGGGGTEDLEREIDNPTAVEVGGFVDLEIPTEVCKITQQETPGVNHGSRSNDDIVQPEVIIRSVDETVLDAYGTGHKDINTNPDLMEDHCIPETKMKNFEAQEYAASSELNVKVHHDENNQTINNEVTPSKQETASNLVNSEEGPANNSTSHSAQVDEVNDSLDAHKVPDIDEVRAYVANFDFPSESRSSPIAHNKQDEEMDTITDKNSKVITDPENGEDSLLINNSSDMTRETQYCGNEECEDSLEIDKSSDNILWLEYCELQESKDSLVANNSSNTTDEMEYCAAAAEKSMVADIKTINDNNHIDKDYELNSHETETSDIDDFEDIASKSQTGNVDFNNNLTNIDAGHPQIDTTSDTISSIDEENANTEVVNISGVEAEAIVMPEVPEGACAVCNNNKMKAKIERFHMLGLRRISTNRIQRANLALKGNIPQQKALFDFKQKQLILKRLSQERLKRKIMLMNQHDSELTDKETNSGVNASIAGVFEEVEVSNLPEVSEEVEVSNMSEVSEEVEVSNLLDVSELPNCQEQMPKDSAEIHKDSPEKIPVKSPIPSEESCVKVVNKPHHKKSNNRRNKIAKNVAIPHTVSEENPSQIPEALQMITLEIVNTESSCLEISKIPKTTLTTGNLKQDGPQTEIPHVDQKDSGGETEKNKLQSSNKLEKLVTEGDSTLLKSKTNNQKETTKESSPASSSNNTKNYDNTCKSNIETGESLSTSSCSNKTSPREKAEHITLHTENSSSSHTEKTFDQLQSKPAFEIEQVKDILTSSRKELEILKKNVANAQANNSCLETGVFVNTESAKTNKLDSVTNANSTSEHSKKKKRKKKSKATYAITACQEKKDNALSLLKEVANKDNLARVLQEELNEKHESVDTSSNVKKSIVPLHQGEVDEPESSHNKPKQKSGSAPSSPTSNKEHSSNEPSNAVEEKSTLASSDEKEAANEQIISKRKRKHKKFIALSEYEKKIAQAEVPAAPSEESQSTSKMEECTPIALLIQIKQKTKGVTLRPLGVEVDASVSSFKIKQVDGADYDDGARTTKKKAGKKEINCKIKNAGDENDKSNSSSKEADKTKASSSRNVSTSSNIVPPKGSEEMETPLGIPAVSEDVLKKFYDGIDGIKNTEDAIITSKSEEETKNSKAVTSPQCKDAKKEDCQVNASRINVATAVVSASVLYEDSQSELSNAKVNSPVANETSPKKTGEIGKKNEEIAMNTSADIHGLLGSRRSRKKKRRSSKFTVGSASISFKGNEAKIDSIQDVRIAQEEVCVIGGSSNTENKVLERVNLTTQFNSCFEEPMDWEECPIGFTDFQTACSNSEDVEAKECFDIIIEGSEDLGLSSHIKTINPDEICADMNSDKGDGNQNKSSVQSPQMKGKDGSELDEHLKTGVKIDKECINNEIDSGVKCMLEDATKITATSADSTFLKENLTKKESEIVLKTIDELKNDLTASRKTKEGTKIDVGDSSATKIKKKDMNNESMDTKESTDVRKNHEGFVYNNIAVDQNPPKEENMMKAVNAVCSISSGESNDKDISSVEGIIGTKNNTAVEMVSITEERVFSAKNVKTRESGHSYSSRKKGRGKKKNSTFKAEECLNTTDQLNKSSLEEINNISRNDSENLGQADCNEETGETKFADFEKMRETVESGAEDLKSERAIDIIKKSNNTKTTPKHNSETSTNKIIAKSGGISQSNQQDTCSGAGAINLDKTLLSLDQLAALKTYCKEGSIDPNSAFSEKLKSLLKEAALSGTGNIASDVETIAAICRKKAFTTNSGYDEQASETKGKSQQESNVETLIKSVDEETLKLIIKSLCADEILKMAAQKSSSAEQKPNNQQQAVIKKDKKSGFTFDNPMKRPTEMRMAQIFNYIYSEDLHAKGHIERFYALVKNLSELIKLISNNIHFPQSSKLYQRLTLIKNEILKWDQEHFFKFTAINISSQAELNTVVYDTFLPFMEKLKECYHDRYIDELTAQSLICAVEDLIKEEIPFKLDDDVFKMWTYSVNGVRKVLEQHDHNPGQLMINNLTCNSIYDMIFNVQLENGKAASKIVPSEKVSCFNREMHAFALTDEGNYTVRVFDNQEEQGN